MVPLPAGEVADEECAHECNSYKLLRCCFVLRIKFPLQQPRTQKPLHCRSNEEVRNDRNSPRKEARPRHQQLLATQLSAMSAKRHEACDVLPEVKRLETVSVTSNKGTMLVTVAGKN
jgi:hypothetical protein